MMMCFLYGRLYRCKKLNLFSAEFSSFCKVFSEAFFLNNCKIMGLFVRISYFQELVAKFNFHNYDNLKHTSKKYDPRGRAIESKAQDVVNLLFSAYNGDVTAMRR